MFHAIRDFLGTDNESTYEERVERRCNHEWDRHESPESRVHFRFTKGRLIAQEYNEIRHFCEKCGYENLSMHDTVDSDRHVLSIEATLGPDVPDSQIPEAKTPSVVRYVNLNE